VRLRPFRPGLERKRPEARGAKQISTELHTLHTNADTEGTLRAGGHSYGGLYTQMYAARYSDEVAGVALVDSSHPEQFTRAPEGQAMYKRTRRIGAVIPWLTRLGVIRLTNALRHHLPERSPTEKGEKDEQCAHKLTDVHSRPHVRSRILSEDVHRIVGRATR
jgi:pimeloyl-ACP methyl ester carboxylesterase